MPNLDQLRCFLAVADNRSFSGAASTLGLSQPSVTQSIKRLESWASNQLVDRTTRPLSLTDAGQVLARKAPAIINQAVQLTALMTEHTSRRREVLRLGMPDSLSEIMGAEIIGSLKEFATQIELKSGISPWLETAFRERYFDLAVDSPPFTQGDNIAVTPLFYDPFVIALPPALKGKDLGAILKNEPLVGYGRSSKFGAECTEISHQLGLTGEPRFSFDSTQSLLRFVQAGYGWAITSAFCLFQSPQALETIAILPCPASKPREFALLHRKGEMDETAQNVQQKFQDVFRRLITGPWHRMAPKTATMIARANRSGDNNQAQDF